MKRRSASDPTRIWADRAAERSLMLWISLTIFVGFMIVLGTRSEQGGGASTRDFLPPLLYAATLTVTHLLLVAIRFRGDITLVCIPLFLAGIGVLAQFRMGILFSGDSAWGLRDLLFPLGVALMLICIMIFRQGRIASIRPFYLLAGLISLGLVAFVLATGVRFRGGLFAAGYMTPSEGLKIFTVIATAGALYRRYDSLHQNIFHSLYALVPLGLFWGALIALLVVQRDLGMALILSLALLGILVFTTRRLIWIWFALAGFFILFLLLGDHIAHGQRRIEAWMDPFRDPTGSGWQILQGLSGMFSGGLWGVGYGQGSPDRIPIAESDFIYAVIGEEFGFLGCALVVGTYLILIHRGLQVARNISDPFASILVAGLSLMIAAQTFINIGGVTKALPLTGVTLPFVSLGGSSMLTSFVMLGMIVAASETDAPPPIARKTPRSRKANK